MLTVTEIQIIVTRYVVATHEVGVGWDRLSGCFHELLCSRTAHLLDGAGVGGGVERRPREKDILVTAVIQPLFSRYSAITHCYPVAAPTDWGGVQLLSHVVVSGCTVLGDHTQV